MVYVGPVDGSAFSGGPGAEPAASDYAAAAFASMLESVRRSGPRLTELFAIEGKSVGARARRHEQVAEALLEPDRLEVLRRESIREVMEAPDRVDQLRGAPQRGYEGVEDSRPLRARVRDQESRARAAWADEQVRRPVERGDGAARAAKEPGAVEPGVSGPERGPGRAVLGGSVSGAEPAVPGPASGSGPGVSGAMGPGNAVVAVGLGSGGSADSSSSGLVVQRVSRPGLEALANQAGVRGSGGGRFPDSLATQGGKTGSPAGRPNGSSVDFQSLLGSAGRHRGAGIRPGPGSAALATGRDPGVSRFSLNEPRSLGELAQSIRANLGSRHSTMMLRLEPPELGQLRIDVRMHDQLLALRFEAQTAAAEEALKGRLTELRTTLEQHGIQLGQVEIEFRPPPAPADGLPDSNSQGPPDPQWGESSLAEGGGDREAGGNSFGQAEEGPGPGAGMAAGGFLGGEGHGEVSGPAETGLDVVV